MSVSRAPVTVPQTSRPDIVLTPVVIGDMVRLQNKVRASIIEVAGEGCKNLPEDLRKSVLDAAFSRASETSLGGEEIARVVRSAEGLGFLIFQSAYRADPAVTEDTAREWLTSEGPDRDILLRMFGELMPGKPEPKAEPETLPAEVAKAEPTPTAKAEPA